MPNREQTPSAAAEAPEPLATERPRSTRNRVRRTIHRLQDRVIALLGSSALARDQLVAEALARQPNEAASYWLQLVVAIGIATLGLVVGSGAAQEVLADSLRAVLARHPRVKIEQAADWSVRFANGPCPAEAEAAAPASASAP